MQRQDIVSVLLFIVFFAIGAASLSGAILCVDLIQYYRNRQLLRAAHESSSRLKSLNADYDVLLGQLEEDPNLIKRVAPAELGTEREDPNTIYPRATVEQLAAARKALVEESNRQPADSTIPALLNQCSEPRRRMMLFFAGAGLILTSFVFFGSASKRPLKKE